MDFLTADSLRCTFDDAPSVPYEKVLTHSVRPDSLNGIEADPRPVTPASSPAVSLLFILFIATVIYNLRHTRRLFASFSSDIFGNRERKNLFEEHTAYETRSLIVLMLQFCLNGTILLYLTVAPPGLGLALTPARLNLIMLLLCGISAGWYLFHIIAYTVIGRVFSTPENTSGWISVFNLSMAVFSLTSLFPIASALYLPDTRKTMLIVTAVLFGAALLLTLIKGFRIFFTNLFSILYFILYLCTVEIIPLTAVYAAARFVIFKSHL